MKTSLRSRSKNEFLAWSAFGKRGSVKVELNQDWTEFLSAPIAHRVGSVLVGGHAVAGRAEPRFTEHLDVFAEPTLANGRRLAETETDERCAKSFAVADIGEAQNCGSTTVTIEATRSQEDQSQTMMLSCTIGALKPLAYLSPSSMVIRNALR